MKNNNYLKSTLLRLQGKRKAFKARCLNISNVEARIKMKDQIDDLTLQIFRIDTIIKLKDMKTLI